MSTTKMRSRQLPDLTNWEIEKYLERNDLIIVPVGHCEMLGATPVDGEYVGAHAWANLIAEYADGLVLPGVHYTCAGGTQTGRGTVYMNTQNSIDYCLDLAHSLLIQGFKTQIWIPSHGPTKMFLGGMVTQFFDETKVSALFLDTGAYFKNMGLVKAHDIFAMLRGEKVEKPEPTRLKDGTIVEQGDQQLGAYKICKRLDIYPAKGEVDFPPVAPDANQNNLAPWFLDECLPLQYCSDIVMPAPIYFETCEQHGGYPVARYTREEMEARAEIGERYMRELAEAADFPALVEGLKKLNKVYMQGSAIPKNMDHLPPNKYAPIIVQN